MKTRTACSGTERPRGALLYPGIELRNKMRRIGGSLRRSDFGRAGGDGEIPPFLFCGSNSLFVGEDSVRRAV